jgi:hypothetical protein
MLVKSLAPTVAVMNNGPRKGTSASALAALMATPAANAIYQIHENVRADHENNTAQERIANLGDLGDGCAANYIKCTVAADGLSYSISIPARHFRQTYQTRLHKRERPSIALDDPKGRQSPAPSSPR